MTATSGKGYAQVTLGKISAPRADEEVIREVTMDADAMRHATGVNAATDTPDPVPNA